MKPIDTAPNEPLDAGVIKPFELGPVVTLHGEGVVELGRWRAPIAGWDAAKGDVVHREGCWVGEWGDKLSFTPTHWS